MDPGDLRRDWHANKHRAAWLRERREALNEVLSVDEPIPDAASLYQLRDWLDRYAPTVTRQLDAAVDDEPPADTPSGGDS